MAWFSRSEIAEKLSAAEAENETLRADLIAAQGGNEQLSAVTQELAEVKEDLESCKASLTEEQAAHDTTKQELADAAALLEPEKLAERITNAANSEEVADAPIKEAVEREVTNRIAASGHPPLNTAKAESEERKMNTLSRTAFEALTARERAAAVNSGVKITD